MDDFPPDFVVPTLAADDARLLDYLKERDVQCPLCDYNLRGLTTPRCPECGQLLKLSVGLAEPYIRAWTAAVVTACLGAGPGLIICIAILHDGVRFIQAPRTTEEFLGWGLVTFCLGSIPLAILLVWRRRRFMAWSKSAQWKAAGTIVAMGITALLVFLSIAIH